MDLGRHSCSLYLVPWGRNLSRHWSQKRRIEVALDEKCSRCGDVVFYCTCPYTDPAVVDDKDYTTSRSFEIYRGEEVVTWDRQTRSLSGDAALCADILAHLDGQQFSPLYLMSLWASPKDPFAVHYVASEYLEGCTFSKTAPNWGRFSKPGVIY